MRTLQEKYNAINEGNFSKDQFLRDARMQLPNLVTQYNGFEDAAQILKNRGIIQEEAQVVKEFTTTEFKDGQKIKNTLSGAFYTVDGKDETGGIYVRSEKGLRKNVPSKYFDAYEIVEEVKELKEGEGSLKNWDTEPAKWDSVKPGEYVADGPDANEVAQVISNSRRGLELKRVWTNSEKYPVGEEFFIKHDHEAMKDGKDDNLLKVTNYSEKGTSISKELKEARITNKSLPDYRYKVTNDLDKYPYEQILRGLRVELESMEVTGTPTAEEYKKALAKVLKNLHADEIFYTNQIAGTNIKVNNHDKMVAVQGKEKEIKNSVDTFNGLKKAALKEGFKRLIKKVLTENFDSSNSKENAIGNNDVWYPNAEEKYEEMLQTWGEEKANKVFPLYLKRIDPTLTPSDFFDIYNNLSEKADPLHDYIKSKDDDYTKTEVENYKKQHEADALNEVGVDITGASNATGAYEIMMHMLDASITNRSEAAKFFSLNHSDMPSQQIEFLINHYFEKFQDEEGNDTQVNFEDSHLLNYEWETDNETEEDLYNQEKGLKEIGMFNDPTGYEDSEPNLQDAIFTKEFVGTSDTPGQHVYDIFKNGEKVATIEGEGNANAWINKAQREGMDEIATDIQGFPKWRELSQDEKDHISKFVKDTGDRDQAEYEKRRDERLKAQSARLDAYIKSQRGIQEDFETVTLSDLLD